MLAVVVQAPAHAEDLGEIKGRISDLEQALANDAVEYEKAREEVLGIERQLHRARLENDALRARLDAKMRRIAELRAERASLNTNVEVSLAAIEALLKARYLRSRQTRLKVLLNHDDLSGVQRKLRYYDYIATANDTRLGEQRRRIETLTDVEAALKLEALRLRNMRTAAESRVEALNETHGDRTRVAKTLEQVLGDTNQALDRLRKDEAELSDLVGDVIADTTDGPRVPFAGLKGALEWPTSGRIAKAPGSAMRDGGAKWGGVIIESPPGSEVTAIANGRVAFADWFRNLGLLVIVDHGDGYMSLYGHNETLYADVGDTIEAGQVVATVGDTGGRVSSGLYFEIRQDGMPQDPRLWCRR